MEENKKTLDMQASITQLLLDQIEGNRVSPDPDHGSEEISDRDFMEMIAQHRAATAHPNFQSYGPQMDLFNEEQIDWQSYLDNIGRSMGPHGTHPAIPDENSDNTRHTSESEGTVMNVPRLGPSGAVLAEDNFNDAPTAHEDTIVDYTPSFQFERHAGPTTRPSGTVLTEDDFDCVPKMVSPEN